MFGFLKRSKQNEFEALSMPYLDALYNAAVRLCRSESDAEDLVQETMLKAFRFFHRFEQGTHIKAWLFKIMTNTFINHYRKQQRDREVVEDWDWDQIAKPDPSSRDFEQRLFAHAISDQVMAALEEIPLDFRMVVMLADIEEFAYKEIAEIVDCPIGTVMSRLYRGRRMLRKLLHGYAVEHGIIDASWSAEHEPDAKVADMESFRRVRAEKQKVGGA
ncbi:sigma-70 family RNA polymerase sigma factor [Myxococcota bacterium]|nr:sigma-70 family RNA polymerase sigma factor [Myxococcota bacterium]